MKVGVLFCDIYLMLCLHFLQLGHNRSKQKIDAQAVCARNLVIKYCPTIFPNENGAKR